MHVKDPNPRGLLRDARTLPSPQAALPVTAPLQPLRNSKVRYEHIVEQTEAGEVMRQVGAE